jgi:hypothetical protein
VLPGHGCQGEGGERRGALDPVDILPPWWTSTANEEEHRGWAGRPYEPLPVPSKGRIPDKSRIVAYDSPAASAVSALRYDESHRRLRAGGQVSLSGLPPPSGPCPLESRRRRS